MKERQANFLQFIQGDNESFVSSARFFHAKGSCSVICKQNTQKINAFTSIILDIFINRSAVNTI
jgi:hypothetical protein